MTGFQKGDKVRLDASGVVVSSDKHGTQVKIAVPAVGNGSDNYFFDDSLLTLVERTAAVGDIVTRADARQLPLGSVITVFTGGFVYLVGVSGRLFDTYGSELMRSNDDIGLSYTVVFVPA